MRHFDFLEMERRARTMQGEEVRRMLNAVGHALAEGIRRFARSLHVGVKGHA